MADLYRIKTLWRGGVGGPASTTMYSTAIPTPAMVNNLWSGVAGQIPIGITWTIQGHGDIIDDATGNLTGAWSSGADATSSSSGAAGAYAAPVGCIIRLSTSTIVHNHHLQGRIYLVPVNGGSFQSDGTLTAAFQSVVQTAASNMNSAFSGHLAVWSRPFPGRPATATKPAVPSRVGSTGLVTGVSVPDFAAVLRSRRD